MNEKIIPFPVCKPLTDRERQRQAEIQRFIAACERLYAQQQKEVVQQSEM